MSVNSKMTALADEIRELSGTEDTMGLDAMANHIGEANTDVATEADLIERIINALENKAVKVEFKEVEWSENENAIVSRDISSYTNDMITIIGDNAFCYCTRLTTVSFPVCSSINANAFFGCSRLTTASFPVCSNIGANAFACCYSLTTVSFPVCTTIGDNAFGYCTRLTTVSFPVCTSIGNSAFFGCSRLTTVSFPVCTSIGNSAFSSCRSLTSVSFPACTNIGGGAFNKCYNLKSLYLTGSTLCTLSNSNAFTSTPIGGYSASAGTYGNIYVPASLLTSYQTATNWTYFSSRFVGI